MVYSNEKKELWRYALSNNASCLAGDGNNLPQQLHHHQHLHHLQSPPPDYYATTRTTAERLQPQQQQQIPCAVIPTTNVMNTSPLTDDRLNQIQQQEEHDMPPPPYSFVPCGIDCSDAYQQHHHQQQQQNQTKSSPCGEREVGVMERGCMEFGGSVDRYSIGGMSYILQVDGKSALPCASVSSRSIVSISSDNNLERNEQDDCYNNNNDNNLSKNKSKKNKMYVDNDLNVVAYDQLSKRTTKTSTIILTTSAAVATTTVTTTTTITTPIVTSTASVLAATAASIFRNCCGGGSTSGVGETSDTLERSVGRGRGEVGVGVGNTTEGSLIAIMQNNKKQTTLSGGTGAGTGAGAVAITMPTTRQYFETFIKQLKESQLTVLLKAVKSRQDPVKNKQKLYHYYNHHQHHYYQQQKQKQKQQQQLLENAANCCILVYRGPILNEEPHVIACRLFFWQDLKDGNELKHLPDCPNACNPVHICCNPLHWCRIKAETEPPPYQLRTNTTSEMQFEDNIWGKNFQNGRSHNIQNNVPTRQLNLLTNQQNIMPNVGLRVQFPESVATAGEDAKARSLIWCELAYWELRQRVGPLFAAKKSSVNVYADNPLNDTLGEGMCLKDFSVDNNSKTAVPEDVQYTREKIGLGVTLSQEADGVWLYNRSRVPIFLHSPTLSESWFRVYRILPGECVKAFDSNRAHLLYSLPYARAHTGPVDTFSMRLSFAKGWGFNYKRQDINRCPCWLEVFFTQR